jgi:signal transduction histidine kinase
MSMSPDVPHPGKPDPAQGQDTPQERALLERVLDGAPVAILVLDRELRVLRANSPAVRMFGIAAGDKGRRGEDVLPGLFAEVKDLLEHVVGGGGAEVGVETSAPTRTVRHSDRRYLSYYYPLAAADDAIIGVGCIFIDISQQRAAEGALRTGEEERRIILGQVLEAEDAERSRLAFDLHDDTIQVLWALMVQFDAMIPLATSANQDDLAARMMNAREMLADVTERTRSLMFQLHPTALPEHGLKAAVTTLAEQIAAGIGAECSVVVPDVRYGRALEELAFRIVGEALSNVRKHSHADSFSIRIYERDDELRGVVKDDGRGFTASSGSSDPGHLGVRGMKERARLAGGDLTVTSSQGNGVSVEFDLPIDSLTEGWDRRGARPEAAPGAG